MTRWQLLLALLGLSALHTQAANPGQQESATPHRIRLGAEFFNRDFDERPSSKQGFLPRTEQEDGNFSGWVLGYEYRIGHDIYYAADIAWANGDAESNLSETDNDILNMEARIGYTISIGYEHDHIWSLFLGYGFHNWERNQRGSRFPDEEYDWQYATAGIKAERMLATQVKVGFNIALRILTDGDVETAFSEIDPTLKDSKTDITDSLQLSLELPLTYQLDVPIPLDIRLTPFYQNLSLDGGRSETVLRTDGSIAGTTFANKSDIDVFGFRLAFEILF